MKFFRVVGREFDDLSPPSQGAWIEMRIIRRAEGLLRSPPSQGAWIEIVIRQERMCEIFVAPLAGGVD